MSIGQMDNDGREVMQAAGWPVDNGRYDFVNTVIESSRPTGGAGLLSSEQLQSLYAMGRKCWRDTIEKHDFRSDNG